MRCSLCEIWNSTFAHNRGSHHVFNYWLPNHQYKIIRFPSTAYSSQKMSLKAAEFSSLADPLATACLALPYRKILLIQHHMSKYLEFPLSFSISGVLRNLFSCSARTKSLEKVRSVVTVCTWRLRASVCLSCEYC